MANNNANLEEKVHPARIKFARCISFVRFFSSLSCIFGVGSMENTL